MVSSLEPQVCQNRTFDVRPHLFARTSPNSNLSVDSSYPFPSTITRKNDSRPADASTLDHGASFTTVERVVDLIPAVSKASSSASPFENRTNVKLSQEEKGYNNFTSDTLKPRTYEGTLGISITSTAQRDLRPIQPRATSTQNIVIPAMAPMKLPDCPHPQKTDTPLEPSLHSLPLTHTNNLSCANNPTTCSTPHLGAPISSPLSPADSFRSTFELSNITLSSGCFPIYAEPTSFLSSTKPTHSQSFAMRGFSLLSPASQPDLRATAAKSTPIQPPPFDRSSTTPLDFQSPTLPPIPALKANKRRSTIIGGVASDSKPSPMGDYHTLITAIKEGDQREQERAMSTIINPLARSSDRRPTVSQASKSRPWQWVQDQYRNDTRVPGRSETSNSKFVDDIQTLSNPAPTQSQLSHHLCDKWVTEVSGLLTVTSSSSHSACPPHTSQLFTPGLAKNKSLGGHLQEHEPLATELGLRCTPQVTEIPTTATAFGSTHTPNLDFSSSEAGQSQSLQSKPSTVTLPSPLSTPNLKPKRSPHAGKLAKLLTKLRKDDPPPPAPSQIDIPPVPPLPSSLPGPTTPSTLDNPIRAPLPTPVEPTSSRQPLPSTRVVKKKQSFTQRIARRLSLSSSRRADTSDPIFTCEAVPLPPTNSVHLAQLSAPSNQPPEPLTPTSKTGSRSNSSADSPESPDRAPPIPTLAHSLDQSQPPSSRPSGSPPDSLAGFEPVAHFLSPTALPNQRTNSRDTHSSTPVSQVYLGLLTPSTSDKDLSNTSGASQSQSYQLALPSPALSYSTTDPTTSSKSYFPACLPSPALSDFRLPASPIGSTFIPAPSPTSRLTHKALAPLDVTRPVICSSFHNPKVVSSAPQESLSPVSYGQLATTGGLSSTHSYISNISTDWLRAENTAPTSSCTDGSASRVEDGSPEDYLQPNWWASSGSDMSPSLITRTSLGGSSYQSNPPPRTSSISAQPGSGRPNGSRPVGPSSTSRVDYQANRSSDRTAAPSFRPSEKRDEVCRGNGSDSDQSSRGLPTSTIDNEVEEEVDSDDSDDVPLGQRHPDALKVQKSLREDRAKRHARRKLREAEKAQKAAKELAAIQRQKAIEDHHRKEAAQRELDLAAAAAKLTMKPNSNDDDDNKPLNLLKRQKSCAKQKPALRDPFTVSPDELSRRLENVQHHGRSKTEDSRSQRVAGLSINTNVASGLPEPVGHPLLPQTDASVQSRKQSQAQLEPLSPFIKESVLTMGGAYGSAVDDDDLDSSGKEQVSSPKYVAMFHNIPTRSRQPESTKEGRAQGRLGKSPKSNAIDLIPTVPTSSPPAVLRREPPKRGQTLGLPSTLPSTTTRKMDIPPDPTESRSPASRSDGLRRGNTTASRKVGPSMSTSPPLPNALVPLHGASSNLSRTKSQARKPSALAIPPQAIPSDATALLSPPIACHSPTIASNPLPRPSRRVLQKVAIIDQTRTVMIEIDEKSTVSDLLKEAEQRGELARHSQGYGEWGVFEVWENLGIERPVRQVETVMSVVDTWTANSDNSYLLIQKHALASLAIQNRAMTAGTWGSNLFCELKPGKWSKKYVILKENGIYFCSNEKGKDEVFLCTLANFDVFYVASSRVKAPRPFAFGVKSLNKFSFFETKSDFIHYFACKDENTQLEWIRRIYDARTFYIMSNAAAATSQEVPRTKLSDPPIPMLNRSSAEHGASSRSKVSASTTRVSSSSHVPPTTESPATEGRSRNPSANGGLSRKPTLLEVDNLSRFRQGTLLGDLNQPGASSRPTQQPALPAHVTPAAGTATRGWEQMGPNERKEHLAEVQARAKSDGKTLLRFQNTDPFAQGPMKKLGADQQQKPLSRSRTLGSRKS